MKGKFEGYHQIAHGKIANEGAHYWKTTYAHPSEPRRFLTVIRPDSPVPNVLTDIGWHFLVTNSVGVVVLKHEDLLSKKQKDLFLENHVPVYEVSSDELESALETQRKIASTKPLSNEPTYALGALLGSSSVAMSRRRFLRLIGGVGSIASSLYLLRALNIQAKFPRLTSEQELILKNQSEINKNLVFHAFEHDSLKKNSAGLMVITNTDLSHLPNSNTRSELIKLTKPKITQHALTK